MPKVDRQKAILDIVKAHRFGSQEALREELGRRGFEVTQATLSRDIRDLRLVKLTGADGRPFYTLPEEWENSVALEGVLPRLFMGVEGVGNLLMVRTRTEVARAVSLGIDHQDWPEVLGTIAGVDTVLLVLRSPSYMETVRNRVLSIAAGSR
jgi:transcriptional regulator of arginine metabolism